MARVNVRSRRIASLLATAHSPFSPSCSRSRFRSQLRDGLAQKTTGWRRRHNQELGSRCIAYSRAPLRMNGERDCLCRVGRQFMLRPPANITDYTRSMVTERGKATDPTDVIRYADGIDSTLSGTRLQIKDLSSAQVDPAERSTQDQSAQVCAVFPICRETPAMHKLLLVDPDRCERKAWAGLA